MVLLDPICFPDDGFRARGFVLKYTNPARYIVWLKRHFRALTIAGSEDNEEYQSVGLPQSEVDSTWEQLRAAWGVPNLEQLRAAFQSIRERKGRVISVFTQNALGYYNQRGQMGRVVGVEGCQQFCTEVFWPHADHIYSLELHRRRLMDEIKNWARGLLVHQPTPGVDCPPSPPAT